MLLAVEGALVAAAGELVLLALETLISTKTKVSETELIVIPASYREFRTAF